MPHSEVIHQRSEIIIFSLLLSLTGITGNTVTMVIGQTAIRDQRAKTTDHGYISMREESGCMGHRIANGET
jgi:hypothetical protein